MSSWDLDPAGIQQVLVNVSVPADALSTALAGLEAAVGAAVTATQSSAIGEAIQQYVQLEDGPRIQRMGTRITAASTGVVDAVTAYTEGDAEMAAAHQRAAIEQVYPPMMSPSVSGPVGELPEGPCLPQYEPPALQVGTVLNPDLMLPDDGCPTAFPGASRGFGEYTPVL